MTEIVDFSNLKKYLPSSKINEYSNTLILDFSQLKLEEISQLNINIKFLSLNNSKNCFSKNNLSFPDILIDWKENKLNIGIKYNNLFSHHTDFLKGQMEMIEDLINNSESGFLEFAHYRKAQILELFYHLNNNDLNYKELLSKQYEFLKLNSKRMKNMYEELLINLK